VLDGFITGAAALVATAIEPSIAPRLIAGHRSAEPGHAIVLEHLGLRPILELDLRLGEGSGAALAMAIIAAAVAVRDGMATFDDAGVAGPA
jgi:nicotinate-nucleotide--dimethylbenzimidazole phosphoribosyltransferase